MEAFFFAGLQQNDRLTSAATYAASLSANIAAKDNTHYRCYSQ